jgi:hypothetical protein
MTVMAFRVIITGSSFRNHGEFLIKSNTDPGTWYLTDLLFYNNVTLSGDTGAISAVKFRYDFASGGSYPLYQSDGWSAVF